jgi:hypothetical protein
MCALTPAHSLTAVAAAAAATTAACIAFSCPWAVAAEREAGYMLLGSMCAAAAPGLLAGRKKQQQILELFEIALGQSAADALTGTAAVAAAAAAAGTTGSGGSATASAGAAAAAAGFLSPAGLGLGSSGDVELELAVSCWWRAAALQALSAYVLGVMGKGFAEDPAQQVRYKRLWGVKSLLLCQQTLQFTCVTQGCKPT